MEIKPKEESGEYLAPPVTDATLAAGAGVRFAPFVGAPFVPFAKLVGAPPLVGGGPFVVGAAGAATFGGPFVGATFGAKPIDMLDEFCTGTLVGGTLLLPEADGAKLFKDMGLFGRSCTARWREEILGEAGAC